MKIYKKTRHSGFTLIEMILYLAISSIFLTGLVYFTWDIIYGRVKSFTFQEVNYNIRFASKRITYEIKNAKSVNSITGSSISLQMTDASRNPTEIQLTGGRIRIGYGLSSSCPINNPCYLTSDKVTVNDLAFTDLSSGNSSNIKFLLTVESSGDRQEYNNIQTVETAVEVRSK